MINDNLLNGLATLLSGGSYNIPSYMAFGSITGTLTGADVSTSGEFDRNPLNTPTVTLNLAKFVGQRLASEAGNEVVNVISITNTSTLRGTGDIQANFLVPSLIHTTSFDIDSEVWIRVQR
jgi:hypothetical protein